jgi:glyoxylase I family protein
MKSGKELAMPSAVQHIAFNCRDLQSQERFYTRHFGFHRARVFNAGTPREFVMLRLGSTCLELFQAAAEVRGGTASEAGVGFKHLAFEVPDLDAALAALRADGIKTDKVIDCSSVVPGMRVCFFNDPDGNRVEIMQGYRDQFPA